MNSIRIQGHLLATSFWHVAQGAEGNVTTVMKAKIASGAATSDGRAPDTPPVLNTVPMVPSNSLRGRLHRATLSVIAEALTTKGEFLTRDAYQMMSNGGQIGGADAGSLTVGELIRARRHVHFGLWGGGPRLIPSSVVTCDLLPVCAETLGSGRVPAKYRDYAPVISRNRGTADAPDITTSIAPGWALLDERMFKRNDDMLQLNESAVQRLAALGPDAANQVAEYQATQLSLREDRKSAKARTSGQDTRTLSDEDKAALRKSDLVNFLTMEVVIPGTVWPVDLRLASTCTAAQIALFARGVEIFLNEQRVGSCGRLGFGQFHGFLEITRDGEPIGSIRWDEAIQAHTLTFTERGYEEALKAELESLTATEINEFAMKMHAIQAAEGKAGKRGRPSKKDAPSTVEAEE